LGGFGGIRLLLSSSLICIVPFIAIGTVSDSGRAGAPSLVGSIPTLVAGCQEFLLAFDVVADNFEMCPDSVDKAVANKPFDVFERDPQKAEFP
jgi:hypothetical protein